MLTVKTLSKSQFRRRKVHLTINDHVNELFLTASSTMYSGEMNSRSFWTVYNPANA